MKKGIDDTDVEPTDMTKINRRARVLPSLVGLAVLASLLWLPSVAVADSLRRGSTQLVSVKPDGTPADGAEPSVSEDGRYVAFTSTDRLTSEDTDSFADVYRKDMTTGQTLLVSVEVVGLPRSQDNFRPSISGDGIKVAYLSGVCFTANPIGGCAGIYAHLRNMSSNSTVLLSDTRFLVASVDLSRDGLWAALQDEEESDYAAGVVSTAGGTIKYFAATCSGCTFDLQVAISGNGRFVAFESDLSRAPSDTDGILDIYRYDRDTDGNGVFDEAGKTAIQLVSSDTGGEASAPDISDNGRRVAFFGQPEVYYHVYVRDFATNTTTLVSQSSEGVRGSGFYYQLPTVSVGGPEGNRISFSSWDSSLDLPDTNPFMDAYLRDTTAGTTSLVSVLPSGDQDVGDKASTSVSYDGKFVAFSATRLTSRTKIDRRIYVRNMETPCSSVCIP